MPDLESRLGTSPGSKLERKVEDSWNNPDPSEVDEKFGLDKKTSVPRGIWDVAKYIPQLAAQVLIFGPAVTAATGITAGGFGIGGYFEAKKAGKKYTWRRFWRDLTSGNRFGFLDYGIFKVPEYFSNFIPFLGGAGIVNKIAKTAFFEATVVPPAVAGYNSLEYIRDKMGWGTFAKRMLTGRWLGTGKEIYQNAVKGKVWKGAKSIYKIAPLLHYVQLNHLPTTELRMAQSAFVNNPIFRYILGKKDKQPKYKMPY